jgi:hypothetical protein
MQVFTFPEGVAVIVGVPTLMTIPDPSEREGAGCEKRARKCYQGEKSPSRGATHPILCHATQNLQGRA